MCTRYYFEIVRSGQRSRVFELATSTVQLIVRGGYLQNIHEDHKKSKKSLVYELSRQCRIHVSQAERI